MKRRNRKGITSYLLDLLMFIIIAGGLVAFFRINNISGEGDLHSFLKDKSNDTEDCYRNKGQGCVTIPSREKDSNINTPKIASDSEINYKGPSNGEPYLNKSSRLLKKDSIDTVTSLNKIDGTSKSVDNIKLEDWPHYIPFKESDCWSVKDEVISSHGVKGTVKYLDLYREPTSSKDKACSVDSGEWIDSYTSKKIKKIDDVTVDYVVGLETANYLGGNKWGIEQKTKFANDPENMVVVSKKSKEDRDGLGLDEWSPKNKTASCNFSKNYAMILKKYNLSLDDNTEEELKSSLSKCKK